MKPVGRSTFRKVYWGTLFGLFLVFVVAASALTDGTGRPSGPPDHPLLIVLAGAFWAWLLLGRPFARRLVPLFVSALSCPGCGEEMDAVDAWSCACGFRDHRERHILVGRCPKCGKAAGHLPCPCCGCTILLW